jgi:mxaL protein
LTYREGQSRDWHALASALLFLLLALFMPPIPLEHNAYDCIVIFDITQSMDVEDYELHGAPASRLAYAREAARRALRELPCGSRVGWGAFAGYRTLLLLAPVEVCGNYGDLLSSLAKVDGSMRWENASEITKGVYWSMRAAKDLGSNPGIIFVTDGQEAPPLDPTNVLPMFDDLKAGQVHGVLMGAGGELPMPIPRTDDEGNRQGYWRADEVIQPGEAIPDLRTPGSNTPGTEHLSALHQHHLEEIAQQVGFSHTRLSDLDSIAQAMLDKRFARRHTAATDLYWIPALVALLLLAVRFAPWGLRAPSALVAEADAKGAPVTPTDENRRG